MHVATPRKLVLPPIGPLFSHHHHHSHRTGALVVDHDSPSDFHHANMRTPTGVHAVASFDAVFATSSPVRKENKKLGSMKEHLSALETFKLDAPMGPSSPTDVDGCSSPLVDDEEKLRLSRERNRLHAQRTRIRKRELLDNLKERIAGLQNEYTMLKQAYDSHVTAVYLLSLGDEQADQAIRGLDDISDLTGEMQCAAQVVCVYDEDVDAAAAASGQTSLILHDKSCQYYHMDPEDDGSGYEDAACSCMERGNDQVNGNGKRPHGSSSPSVSLLTCSKEEREQIRRERNRLHARRARLRKKLMLEKSQQAVQSLRTRNETLRARLAVLVTSIYEGRQSELPSTGA